MASPSEVVLLKSTLEIQNKPYSVKLTSAEIYWEQITSSRAAGGPYSEPLVSNKHHYTRLKQVETSEEELYTLALHRDLSIPFKPKPPNKPSLFGCCCGQTENQTVKVNEIIAVRLGTRQPQHEGKLNTFEMESLSASSFTLYVVRRAAKHKWRERKVAFHSKDPQILQQWVDKINEMLDKPELSRPKSLLVFINPVGGKRRAPKVYHEKVAPLFDLAGINTEVVSTQRANHARDAVIDYDFSKIDGVVCVGGDGMFTELVHGLLARAHRLRKIDTPTPNQPLPKVDMRIGIIPAGSTDTVAYTSVGINDPISSAIHIILGDSIGIDVGTVHHANKFIKYNVSMMAYGFYGDCLVDSERHRWMGPKRYDYSGAKKLLNNQVYEGEISFLPSPDRENNPRDGTACKVGCTVCQSISNTDESNENGIAADNEKGWQKIKGRFMAINSFIIACRCHFSREGPAPSSHLGDGFTDLVVVSQCDRTGYFKHLYRSTKADKDQFDLPFVQVFRVNEFKFRPNMEEVEDSHDASDVKIVGQQRLRSRSAQTSVWNCDGEVVEEPSIDYRVHRQVIKLFARGPEDDMKYMENTCLMCCA